MRKGHPSSSLLPALATLTLVSCATPRWSPEPFLTVAIKAVNLEAVGPGHTAVTCPPSRKLIGGGFLAVTPSGRQNYVVRGSYPLLGNWIVEVENFQASPDDKILVQAVAYCLDVSRVPASVTTDKSVQTDETGAAGSGYPKSTTVSCPAGAVLTGGGFRIAGDLISADAGSNAGIQELSPTPNTWTVRSDSSFMAPGRTLSFESYAVCATAPITPGVLIVQPLPTIDLPLVGARSGASAKCDTDSFTTVGGFYQSRATFTPLQLQAFQSTATEEFREWTVDLFAPARNEVEVDRSTNPPTISNVSRAGAIALCIPVPALN